MRSNLVRIYIAHICIISNINNWSPSCKGVNIHLSFSALISDPNQLWTWMAAVLVILKNDGRKNSERFKCIHTACYILEEAVMGVQNGCERLQASTHWDRYPQRISFMLTVGWLWYVIWLARQQNVIISLMLIIYTKLNLKL